MTQVLSVVCWFVVAMTIADAALTACQQIQRQRNILKWVCDVLLPGAVQQMERTVWIATDRRSQLPSRLVSLPDMILNVRLI